MSTPSSQPSGSQSTEKENQGEQPWYKNLSDKSTRKLPYMFCMFGEKINFPDEAKDKSGIPLVPPIIVIPDVDNPQSYKPFHVLVLGLTKYTCLVCSASNAGNNQEGNHSNPFNHVKSQHLEYFPINLWSEDGAKKLEEAWLKKLNAVKSKCGKPRSLQPTILQAIQNTKSVSEQVKAWVRAIVLGQTIPLSI